MPPKSNFKETFDIGEFELETIYSVRPCVFVIDFVEPVSMRTLANALLDALSFKLG